MPRRNPDDGTNESLLATAFWFFPQATHGPVDVRADEADRIDNALDVFSKTFLGLTVACARCHDHKFDAISARDYYALAGVLQSTRRQIAYLDPHGRIAGAAAASERRSEAASTALHAGHNPGYPASHGCIRLPSDFAKKLYSVTDLGATVMIGS